MGFIRGGQFHLLFSAALPLGERERGVDVPNTFQPLIVEEPTSAQPRAPGCVAASTLQVGASLDGPEPIIQCVLALRLFPTSFKRVSSRSLERGVDFSFELTGDRGAALTTRHLTYNEDSQSDSVFKIYTKRHYKSWVKFASDKGYGEDLRPVLVSGFDMTKDFAMIASNLCSIRRDFFYSDVQSPSASAWGTWRTACRPHVNMDHSNVGPPSSTTL